MNVKNIPGGAILSYTLPDDEDLLYVKAVYNLKEGLAEAKSSLYTDTIKVVGFGDMEPREVSLIAVDRSRNESAPVKVTVNPEEPPVLTIGHDRQYNLIFHIHHYYNVLDNEFITNRNFVQDFY